MRPVIFAFSTAFLPGTVLQKPHRYGKLQIRTEQEVCSVEIGNTNTLFCDLHTHSTCSDGTLTPEELVGLALERGLGAIALTDHNTVAGCARFAAAAAGRFTPSAVRSFQPILPVRSCICWVCFCRRSSLTK